jgi:hypothetical protein
LQVHFQTTLTGDGEIESFFGSRPALATFNTGSTPEKAGGQQMVAALREAVGDALPK